MSIASEPSRGGPPSKRSGGIVRLAGRFCVWVLLASLLVSCKSTRSGGGSSSSSAPKISETELREKLGAFYIEFVNVVETATSQAAMQTEDQDLRQQLVERRIRAVRTCRQTIFQRRPMAALVDTWSYCLRMERHLSSPPANESFGDANPQVLKAARQLHEDIRGLAATFLKPDQMTEIKDQLEKFAREHPLSAQNYSVSLPSEDSMMLSMPTISWLLDIPLSPFRALQGVDETAAAIHELTFVARNIAQTASDMPRELSWETQLLLMHTRGELLDILADIDRRQTNAQATLVLVRGAITDAEKTLKATAEASTAIDGTLKTFIQMMSVLSPPKPATAAPPPETEPGRPFDILDYAKTAEQIGVTATDLGRLLVEVQRTVGANALTERINETQVSAGKTINEAEASMRRLATRIALLAALVIVVFFLSLTGYRIVAARLRRDAQVAPAGR